MFIKDKLLFSFMVRLQFDSKQYKITLPKAIIEAKGWKKGNDVRVMLNERGELVLTNDG
jgi:hypothetical protein